MEKNDASMPVEMRFKFTIELAKYAKRFGISLPDDSSDVISDDVNDNESDTKDCACCDTVAEDAASLSFASNFAPGSLAGQCQATLAQCKAKNPMTCRYHGAQVIANDIEASLRAAGVNAPVNVEFLGITNSGGKQLLSATATITASPSDKKSIESAMDAFFKNPGVENGFVTTPDGKHYDAPFDIDMLNPGAKAKWGSGHAAPAQTVSQQTQPSQEQRQSESESPVAATKKPRPTRKRVKKADGKAEMESQAEIKQTSEPVAEVDVSLDDDAPELYPDQRPPKPPDWKAPFDAKELDTLAHYAERIGKTAERLDGVLDKEAANPGYLAQYLAKGNGKQGEPNANLPRGLQHWKNKVDVANLRALAEKDTDGQVKAMLAVAEKIDASEANGWKDRIGVAAKDVEFDPSKYADPYAKERAAYEAYVPGDKGRDSGVSAADSVLSSKDKNAPKDAADAIKSAHKDMKDLEEGFKALADSPKAILKTLAQAYHKANEKFKDGVANCKKWLASLSIMGASVKDTAENFRSRNGRDAVYLARGLENNLKTKRKEAIDICKRNSRVFAADPEGCTALFEKNAKFMFENGSARIAMSFACLKTLLADPDKPDVSSGFKNGRYTPARIDYCYVDLAKCHFGATDDDFDHGSRTEKALRNIHKYGALFPKSDNHSGDMRSLGYGEIEVELDMKKCLAFWGGCHSQTRYSNLNLKGSNASLVTDPKITMAPYLYTLGGSLDELFTTDFTKVKDGWQRVYNILSRGGNSRRKGDAIPELWFADDVLRDMVSGIHPKSKSLVSKIKNLNPDFIKNNGIRIG